jgi:hypothetical protein
MTEWLGCGVSTHDEYCLCDVIITAPLVPMTECVRDGVTDMFMGEELVALRGYEGDWDRYKILNYFEDLVTFWDAWHAGLSPDFVATSLQDVPPLFLEHETQLYVKWKQIRVKVQYCMDRFDECLVDILKHINISAQEFADAVCIAKAGSDWDYDKVQKLDELFMKTNLVFVDIAREMDLSVNIIDGMRKYWQPRRTRLGFTGENQAKIFFKQLCGDLTLSNKQIVTMVEDAYGVKYSTGAISKCRKRMMS